MKKKCLFFKMALIALLLFAGQRVKAQDTLQVQNVTAEVFNSFMGLNSNAIIIDVREQEMYNKKRISGAVNLPQKEDLIAFTDTIDKETPILIYCEIGKRSREAAKVLLNLHFVTIVNLEFGFKDWLNQNYPVEK